MTMTELDVRRVAGGRRITARLAKELCGPGRPAGGRLVLIDGATFLVVEEVRGWMVHRVSLAQWLPGLPGHVHTWVRLPGRVGPVCAFCGDGAAV
jgi:hypothetical protein